MSAVVGHDWAQAGWTSSRPTSRPSVLAVTWTRLIRCTQKVHFSMMPFVRTVTSGLSWLFIGSGHSGFQKLK